jgi:hypothetical protein
MGIRVDSSMVPLRWVRGMHPWFLSPRDPHDLDLPELEAVLREVPLTMAEVLPGSARAAHGLANLLPEAMGQALLTGYRFWAAAGPQPTMYSLAAMRLGARRHLARGGRGITMYLHSSELMPGATPTSRDEAAVERLVEKVAAFVQWLRQGWEVEPVVLGRM